MDGQLIFCNDGILRFKSSSDENNSVPLILIQQQQELSASRCFLQNIRKSAVIEKGSTMGSFIMALEPWAEIAGDIVDRNVKAYVDAVRKPAEVVDNVFDRVEIKKLVYVQRDIDFGEKPDDIDFFDWLNTPKDPVMLNTFEIDSMLDICGYKDGDASNYSMSNCSIDEIKNVPLVINRITSFIVHKVKIDTSKPIIDESVDGIYVKDYMIYAETKNDTSFDVLELLESVFVHGLFYSSPQCAAISKERILESIAQLDDISDDDIDQQENNQKTKLTVVGEEDEIEEEENGDIKEIKIAEGAFDSIIQHYDYEKKEWDHILANVDKNSRYPIRIGEVKEDLIKDRRIRGKFLDDGLEIEREED